jgi:hypothetical protein
MVNGLQVEEESMEIKCTDFFVVVCSTTDTLYRKRNGKLFWARLEISAVFFGSVVEFWGNLTVFERRLGNLE